MKRMPLLLVLLLAPAAVAAQQVSWSDAETVTVTLSNFAFAPERIELDHGRTYRLHLVNAASGGHNFVARDFFAGATVAPADRERIVNGKIEVPAGGSVDVRLMPPEAGRFDLHCSHFGHSAFGMTGEIVVR